MQGMENIGGVRVFSLIGNEGRVGNVEGGTDFLKAEGPKCPCVGAEVIVLLLYNLRFFSELASVEVS